jgi:hypothetical protein
VCVEANVCQGAAANVLNFASHGREDDAVLPQAGLLHVLAQVGLARRWKAKDP